MTEVVQKRLESMHEEIEEMRRLKLFTSEEIRVLLKKRKEFEHKIHTMAKDLQSFENYIKFERCLLKDIQLRRDKFKVGDKKNSIDHKIIKRIKVLYECAMQKFPTEVPLFLAFIKFCKKVKYAAAAIDSISKMIKHHPDKPEIWKISACYHAYDRNDGKTAMILLLKAIQIHKCCRMLYKEIVSVELYNVTRNSSEKENSVLRLTEIVNTIFINIDDVDFYIEILKTLEEHYYTIEIQKMIISKLLKDCWDNETVWHTLAQRARKGLQCDPEGTTESLLEINSKTSKTKLKACFEKYNEGLEKVSKDVKKNLWCLYVDFLIELQQDTLVGASRLKLSTLKSVLNDAYADGALKEKHFVSWLELIDINEGLSVSEKGTKSYPESVELWYIRLKLQIKSGDSSKVNEVFKLAINCIKEKSLSLWLALIRYYCTLPEADYVELIYKDGIQQLPVISNPLKVHYLEWTYLEKGIEAARNVYNEIATDKPYCRDLHKEMAKLETIQINCDYNLLEKVHELACKQFGNDVDVWIEAVKFYIRFYKKLSISWDRVLEIQHKAMETLPKSLTLEFATKLSSFKNTYNQ